MYRTSYIAQMAGVPNHGQRGTDDGLQAEHLCISNNATLPKFPGADFC
jgi:hypothetical protein